jgi:3-hydroxybutyryl-CoA dehydrogenase
MTVYIIGNSLQGDEIRGKIAKEHSVELADSIAGLNLDPGAVIFDFTFDDTPDDLDQYTELADVYLFINATRCSLAELTFVGDSSFPNLFGIAGDPTFLERPLMEVSAHFSNKVDAQEVFSQLGLDAILVEDRVGLVTPRIIAMIINEAYYTVMEGTASRKDIDTGMKLGTNYPMGPFEWVAKWGIANVYELLEALYLDSKDERYKICPLLKSEYLQLAHS